MSYTPSEIADSGLSPSEETQGAKAERQHETPFATVEQPASNPYYCQSRPLAMTAAQSAGNSTNTLSES